MRTSVFDNTRPKQNLFSVWLSLFMSVVVVLVVLGVNGETASAGPGLLGPDPLALTALSLTCRLGYAVIRHPLDYYNPSVLQDLRAGLYINYQVSANPPQPLGIEHVQVVRIHQNKTGDQHNSPYVVPYTYTVKPDFSTLQSNAQSNPGALWAIANEPDRRDWISEGTTASQDETVPELFAQAYYEIYNL